MKAGRKAPDFELNDTSGNKVKLSSFKGRYVVLYFYPKDLTPGCTIEACGFRDMYKDYKSKNIVILGISLDDENLHQRFTEKYKLPFVLLCDTDKKVSKLYGVYGEKKFMGRTFMGINRTTFIIGKTGKIAYIFDKVNVKTHNQDVLDVINKLK